MENLSSSSNDSLTEKINEQLQGSVQKKSTKGTNLQVTPNFTSNNSYKIDKIIHNEPNEE